MRILLLSKGFEPRLQRLQPHHTLLAMAQQIQRMGHDISLLSDGAQSLDVHAVLQGLPLQRIDSTALYRSRRNGDLSRAVDAIAPDLVLRHLSLASFYHQSFDHPFDAPTLGILTTPAHKPEDMLRLGPRKVYSNKVLIAAHTIGSLVPRSLVRHAFDGGNLQGVITLSDATRQILIDKDAPEEHLWTVPPGVDQDWLEARVSPEVRQQTRRAFGFHEKDFVVTYFGSPAPVRGLGTLINAFEVAVEAHPNLRLLVLSRRRPYQWKAENAELERMAQSDKLRGRLKVVDGFMEQTRLVECVASSDAISLPFELLPSDVPLSILEAMALGRSVITTNVACIPELVGHDRGFMVRPGSVDELAAQLKVLVSTPQLAHRTGLRAREYVQRERTWTNMRSSLASVLERVPGIRRGERQR